MGTITRRSTSKKGVFGAGAPVPGILVAFSPAGAAVVDLCILSSPFIVGRSPECDLQFRDNKVSNRHFRVTKEKQGYSIEDLVSTNGTFLDGALLKGKALLHTNAVIRCGRSILVFHDDIERFLQPISSKEFGMAGRFHTGQLITQLRQAALSARNVLLTGYTGTGKELAARALAIMMGGSRGALPMVTHNAAHFATEDEASTTLFGVSKRVFSNVDARQGLIEKANGGLLFLDEVHNLPERVQRGLLRVVEHGWISRIGDTLQRQVDVRFVFASNASGPYNGLAHDLYQRVRRVHMPSLHERVADIPTIFNAVLRDVLARHGVEESQVVPFLGGDHYEALLLDGLVEGNVRELIDLADKLATSICDGIAPQYAVRSIFSERFSDSPLLSRPTKGGLEPWIDKQSRYDQNKALIVQTVERYDGNLTAAERYLRSRGIVCSRRWLSIYCKRWGVSIRHRKKRSES